MKLSRLRHDFKGRSSFEEKIYEVQLIFVAVLLMLYILKESEDLNSHGLGSCFCALFFEVKKWNEFVY